MILTCVLGLCGLGHDLVLLGFCRSLVVWSLVFLSLFRSIISNQLVDRFHIFLIKFVNLTNRFKFTEHLTESDVLSDRVSDWIGLFENLLAAILHHREYLKQRSAISNLVIAFDGNIGSIRFLARHNPNLNQRLALLDLIP